MTEADKGFPKICKLSVIGKVQQKGFLQHNYLCRFPLLLGSADGVPCRCVYHRRCTFPPPPACSEDGKNLAVRVGGLLRLRSFTLKMCAPVPACIDISEDSCLLSHSPSFLMLQKLVSGTFPTEAASAYWLWLIYGSTFLVAALFEGECVERHSAFCIWRSSALSTDFLIGEPIKHALGEPLHHLKSPVLLCPVLRRRMVVLLKILPGMARFGYS